MRKVIAVLLVLVVYAGFAFAAEKARDGRFVAYDNGTVLDTQTNLMWAAKDNGKNMNWADAKSYCRNYRGGGHKDWRLPTQAELGTLYDDSVKGKNGYHLTTLITLTASSPWTSDVIGANALRVNFTSGGRRISPQTAILDARALPVRSGK